MPSGVYSNQEIRQAIKDNKIIFHPYRDEHIAGSSVDVTLGKWYYRTEYNMESRLYNPFDKTYVDKYFVGPLKAERHRNWIAKSNLKAFKNIPLDHPIIVLKPGERILAHTHEFIGIKPPGTSTMQARSTLGRNGITVCLDAGWGDPGYINRWTMEIYNLNQHYSVVLPLGERIAQIVFHHTGQVDQSYKDISGKYQTTNDLKTLVKNWQPSDMLPKAYLDKRKMPPSI